MVWFIRNSYGFIGPRGFFEHVRFLLDLPGAYIRYLRV